MKMKDSIFISEVTHTGEVHLQVNSCFVEIIADINSERQVFFYAEEEHNLTIKNNLSQKILPNLNFIPFKGYYNEKNFKWKSKIFGECLQILKVLNEGKKRKINKYVWTCIFPTGHFFLNFLNLFSLKNKHVIILHGELELLNGEKMKNIERYLSFILRTALFLSNKRIKYLVLGENIKKTFSTLVQDRVIKRTFSIIHPYNFDYTISKPHPSNVLSIGAIGTQTLAKNSNLLYELADCFKNEIKGDQLHLISIGKILPELVSFNNGLVQTLHSDDFVAQDIFEHEIVKLNFIIFFYDNHAYKLCASGAIFEAIRLGLPIISLRNDYFQWIFDTYAPMGFLCEDLNEIKDRVANLVAGKYQKDIESFKMNIEQFKKNNDLKSISHQLKDILS